MIEERANCFALRTTKAGKHKCDALKELRCVGCGFYKPGIPAASATQIYAGMIRDKIKSVRRNEQPC